MAAVADDGTLEALQEEVGDVATTIGESFRLSPYDLEGYATVPPHGPHLALTHAHKVHKGTFGLVITGYTLESCHQLATPSA
jgi:hypothetical protein